MHLPFVVMRREVSAFGAYSILTLVLEIFIFIFATVVISRLLSQLQKDDDLHIPTWRLFSNPIVTGSLVSISFLTLVVMAATYSAAYEGTWVRLYYTLFDSRLPHTFNQFI